VSPAPVERHQLKDQVTAAGDEQLQYPDSEAGCHNRDIDTEVLHSHHTDNSNSDRWAALLSQYIQVN